MEACNVRIQIHSLSNLEAKKVVVVVVVGVLLISVNHALDMAELLDVARNVNGTLVIKPILFLGFLQQLNKEWVVDVYDRDYNPLLLLPLPHHNSQTALRNVLHHHLLLVVEMKVGEVQRLEGDEREGPGVRARDGQLEEGQGRV
ncbi:hypothetical protein RHSIM_Rhsim03G0213600 [Rhododendron simsii]|uniref:Uncharacterized protein n=1 Tax=Rhododendron simsii TaxID=118357 RepID=A0A834LP17_RHOSS|nr:hypothetical protein RHSIM_Rhsim03G0213600 [Rhododendron simsii]